MKNSKQVLNESSLILVLSTILTKVISAIFKIPLASDIFLGNVGFGYFSFAHDLFMPFYILAISGLPVALSKLTAEYLAQKSYSQVKKNFYTAKRLFLFLGIAFSLALALLSIPLVLLQSSKNTLFSIIAVVPAVFMCFVISVYRGYFEGFSNMYPSAVSKIIEALIKLILGLVLSFVVIKLTNNPALSAAAAMTSISVGTLISTLYLRYKFKYSNPLNNLQADDTPADSQLSLKTIFILAIPFIVSALASSIVALIDVFTINFQFSNASNEYMDVVKSMYFSTGELHKLPDGEIIPYLYGIKSKAFTLYNLVPTITMSLGIAALPVLTNSLVSKDYDSLRNNTQYIIKLLLFVTLPAAVGLTVLGCPIMELLYSSSDALSGNLLSIYGIAALFAGIAIPLTTVLQALNCHYKALWHIIIGIILKIILNVALVAIPSVNIYAAPIGTVACYFYILVAFIVILKLKVKQLNVLGNVIKPLISALACGITAFIISCYADGKIFTVLAIFCAVLVYFMANFLLRTFKKTEISYFLKFRSK